MQLTFFFFFVFVTHTFALKKHILSSPLTLSQEAQQHTLMSFSGLHNAGDTTHTSSSLGDISPSSASFSLGLGTPFDGSLLSPPGIYSPVSCNLSTSIGPMESENSAYIQLVRQYNLMENELRREKQEHNRLK